jgi:hypothetical protein
MDREETDEKNLNIKTIYRKNTDKERKLQKKWTIREIYKHPKEKVENYIFTHPYLCVLKPR